MNALAADAIGNAKMRAQSGWPLVLVTIALYSPLGGLPRLVLIAVGLVFLARQTPGHSSHPDKSRPAPAKPRPASRPKPKAPASKPKPAPKTPRRRTPEGKWTK